MKPVWGFIWILLITLFVLTLYSYVPYTLHIGHVEVKKTHFAQFVLGDTTKVDALVAADITWKRPPVDTSKQIILLAGDSMLEQLRYAMKDYCDYNGHQLYVVMWYSATTKYYGQSDTLEYFIKKFHPTYVILVLGANELFVPKIKDRRAKYVKNILRQIDTLPFVWVGPPNWKKDSGINDLIASFVGADHFFPSYKMTMTPDFKRFKDGAHPVYSSAYRWMDSIAVWIMTHSAHPIKLEKPPYQRHKNPHLVVLQPLT